MQKIKKTAKKEIYNMSQGIPSIVNFYDMEVSEDQIDDDDEYGYYDGELEEEDRE